MTEDNKTKQAKMVFDTLCKVFERKRWKYERQGTKLAIRSKFSSKDFPIEFLIRVSTKNEIVSLVSRLPFKVEDGKSADAALAIAVANNNAIDGSFNYDIETGSISFKFTSNYRDSVLGEGLFEFMVACAIKTIDDYNDKFFMLSKGMITLEQFIQGENESRR